MARSRLFSPALAVLCGHCAVPGEDEEEFLICLDDSGFHQVRQRFSISDGIRSLCLVAVPCWAGGQRWLSSVAMQKGSLG
jgi:hypothetical protein